MDSDEDEEEDRLVEFWNNWLPDSADDFDEVRYESRKKRITKTEQNFDFSFNQNSRFGNWIPPKNFLNISVNNVRKPVENERHLLKRNGAEASTFLVPCRKAKQNLDWGQRCQLHDVTKFNDGDLIWGVVRLGAFNNIKLWVNEYGNVCCLASGKISKIGSLEVSFISITNTELLRKMLNISTGQWASLCETVKETKTILKFDAFQDTDLQKAGSLEKLWFFICKRRNLLPQKSMLLKLDGAVKCLKKFEIRPKLLVQDVRDILGEPIL